MVSKRLLPKNQKNWEMLKRSSSMEWHNIYSFGIPGKVEIAYSKQFYKSGAETWMLSGPIVESVSVDSPKWLEFRNRLTEESLKLREEAAQQVYAQYLVKDAVLVFGAPTLLLLGFMAGSRAKRGKSGNQA